MTIVYPDDHYPLGATWDKEGVNFALYAPDSKPKPFFVPPKPTYV